MLSIDTIIKYKMLGLKLSAEDEQRLKEWDEGFEKIRVPRHVNLMNGEAAQQKKAKAKVVRTKNIVKKEDKTLGEVADDEDGRE